MEGKIKQEKFNWSSLSEGSDPGTVNVKIPENVYSEYKKIVFEQVRKYLQEKNISPAEI